MTFDLKIGVVLWRKMELEALNEDQPEKTGILLYRECALLARGIFLSSTLGATAYIRVAFSVVGDNVFWQLQILPIPSLVLTRPLLQSPLYYSEA